MKHIIFAFAIVTISLAACENAGNKSAENKKRNDTIQFDNSLQRGATTANVSTSKVDKAMKGMVAQYLQIKNALANDNGKDAANAGNAFVESMSEMDKTSLPADKKKVWDNIADDAKEMAEHIGKNAGKLDHQREHFDMLSNDMYDLVKSFKSGQTLYQTFCPMYNNKKGAAWLSETKEIRNPYLGKKMSACGSVKEEIK